MADDHDDERELNKYEPHTSADTKVLEEVNAMLKAMYTSPARSRVDVAEAWDLATDYKPGEVINATAMGKSTSYAAVTNYQRIAGDHTNRHDQRVSASRRGESRKRGIKLKGIRP